MIEKFFKVDELARRVLSDQQLREYYNNDRLLFEDEMKNFTKINTYNFNDQLEDVASSDKAKIDFKSES